MNETDIYQKKGIYRKSLEPLIDQIKMICSMEKMPMFITVAVENTEEKTVYASNMLMAGTGVNLTENKISELLLRLNDIKKEYPDYIKKDMQELREYVDRISVDDTAVDLELADDKLHDMKNILSSAKNINGEDEYDDLVDF